MQAPAARSTHATASQQSRKPRLLLPCEVLALVGAPRSHCSAHLPCCAINTLDCVLLVLFRQGHALATPLLAHFGTPATPKDHALARGSMQQLPILVPR
jgi:hypothetical protein